MKRTVRRKLVFLFALPLLLAAGFAWAQDPQDLLKSHLRNFAIASLETKLEIVLEAGRSGR